MSRPCIFFDRDGIVNRYPGEGHYVEDLDGFHLMEEFLEALSLVLDRGYEAVIVTNQRGVSLGKTHPEDLKKIHDHLMAIVHERKLRIIDIMICTDMEDTFHRKPNPGMILDAAKEHDLDLERSWMIGDSERDIIAGQRAGCAQTVLVRKDDSPTAADHAVDSMEDLVSLLRDTLPKA